ncbi:MAG: isochorismatase family protein [Gammaproteobacteria bacterium]|nr:isochorismatase family protein [Gammaproteobacteria bacterium]
MPDLERRSQPLGPRPALLLVDLINAFTDTNHPLGGPSNSVISASAELLDSMRQLRLPVCFTKVVYTDSAQASVFRARLPALNTLAEGAYGTEVDSRLTPQPEEKVLTKQFASAFFGTDLDAWLRQQHCDSLIVCGLTTSGCVRATVVDGLQHNYPVWVPRESVGDRNQKAHLANLHDMHAKYAEVVSLDCTLSRLAMLAEISQSQTLAPSQEGKVA